MGEAAPSRHRFYVHARDEGRGHSHPAPGAVSLQDAALHFVEHWPGAAEGGEVRVVARDSETGEERCFCIDLGENSAEPCA